MPIAFSTRGESGGGAASPPTFCLVYEIYDADGETFIAMARIEGEAPEAKTALGPLPIK